MKLLTKLKGLTTKKYFLPAVIALAAGVYFLRNRKPRGSGQNNPGAGAPGGSGTNNSGVGSGGSGGGNIVVASEPSTKVRNAPYIDNTPGEGFEVPGLVFNTIAGDVLKNTQLGPQLGVVSDEGGGRFPFRKVTINNWEALGLEESWEDGNIYYVREDVSYLN
jgi:hypothetical protein